MNTLQDKHIAVIVGGPSTEAEVSRRTGAAIVGALQEKGYHAELLELVPDKKKRAFFPERGTVGPRCRDHALKHGLILRATWDAMLLSPPLIITRAQVDELFDKTWKALNDTAADLGM